MALTLRPQRLCVTNANGDESAFAAAASSTSPSPHNTAPPTAPPTMDSNASEGVRLSRRAYVVMFRAFFHQTCSTRGRFPILPLELVEKIHCHNYPEDHEPVKSATFDYWDAYSDPRYNPSIPPADKCPILGLPDELLSVVVADWLPAKDVSILPWCGQAHGGASDDLKEANGLKVPKRNRTSDLMTVCQKFKNNVALAVYEERKFVVHVHQGTASAGVEFLHAGRQPLGYQSSLKDDRFAKFTARDEFGFRNLKKIEIMIYPAEENARHKATTINTYYMNQALVRLLSQSREEKDRIVSLTITFPEPHTDTEETSGRSVIISGEHYWWDPDTSKPRCTTYHCYPDIEFVLLPFAKLTTVHNVEIQLPSGIRSHAPTKQFVDHLTLTMTDGENLPPSNAAVWAEQNAEYSRFEVEDFIFRQRFGRRADNITDMTENEFDEEEVHGAHEGYPKHGRSTDREKGGMNKKRRLLKSYTSVRDLFGDVSIDDDGVSLSDEDVEMLDEEMQEAILQSSRPQGGQTLGSIDIATPDHLLASLAAARNGRRSAVGNGLMGQVRNSCWPGLPTAGSPTQPSGVPSTTNSTSLWNWFVLSNNPPATNPGRASSVIDLTGDDDDHEDAPSRSQGICSTFGQGLGNGKRGGNGSGRSRPPAFQQSVNLNLSCAKCGRAGYLSEQALEEHVHIVHDPLGELGMSQDVAADGDLSSTFSLQSGQSSHTASISSTYPMSAHFQNQSVVLPPPQTQHGATSRATADALLLDKDQ